MTKPAFELFQISFTVEYDALDPNAVASAERLKDDLQEAGWRVITHHNTGYDYFTIEQRTRDKEPAPVNETWYLAVADLNIKDVHRENA